MDTLTDVLRKGFSEHVDDVEVRQLGERNYHIRFKVNGREFGCAATSIAAGFSTPDETAFTANTWAYDPLFAFGRNMDWRLIDGFDSDRNPDGEVRVGRPSELAEMVKQAAAAYSEARWPSPQTERHAFR